MESWTDSYLSQLKIPDPSNRIFYSGKVLLGADNDDWFNYCFFFFFSINRQCVKQKIEKYCPHCFQRQGDVFSFHFVQLTAQKKEIKSTVIRKLWSYMDHLFYYLDNFYSK